VVCSPPYLLGRVGIILLGSRTFFVVGVILLVIAVPLQTGAVTATKAVKFSAKLVTGQAVALGGGADRPRVSADPGSADVTSLVETPTLTETEIPVPSPIPDSPQAASAPVVDH
jgi:hypothetical protein